MDNNINFKGAFWLSKPSTYVKNDILHTLGNNKKIFYNFTSQGDVLYVTSKKADKNVAEFLSDLNKIDKKTKFKYYPKLNIKSDFAGGDMDKARKILAEYKDKIITNTKELNKFFKLNKPVFNFSTRKKDNTLEKCLQTLKLDIKDYNVKKLNGFSEIYTKGEDPKLVATVSEPGLYGFRYVRIEPQKPGDNVERYSVIPGEKFSYINSPDEKIQNATSDFLKNFFKSVNANKITHT